VRPWTSTPGCAGLGLEEYGPVNTKRAHEAAAIPVALTPQQALWLELMQFYIREAWLLDERKFKDWLDLLEFDG
jgi:hypothetical protein